MRKNLAFILILISSFSQAQQVDLWLGAKMDGSKLLDNSNVVETWGFGWYSPGLWGMTLPAPLIQVTQGDTVNMHVINASPEDHTIHLHGLDVPTDMDGVPSTSFEINPGDTATYTFVADYAGIFLYHCHVLTTLHLTMGMYGMIAVNANPNSNLLYNGGPSFNSVYHLLSSDMDESVNANPLSPGPFNEFKSDYFMVNGLSGNQLYNSTPNQVTAYVGDSVLMRLGSMAYTKTIYYFPPELNAVAYMSDGRVLPAPFDCDTLVMHSGERYSVLLTPSSNVNTDIRVESYEMRNNQLEHTNLIKLNGDIGFGENDVNKISVYPNPTNGHLYFITETPGSLLQVYDLNGSLVYQDLATNNNSQLNLSFLENGAYILRYQSESYKVIINK